MAGWHTERSRIPEGALGVDLRRRGPTAAHVALWRAMRSAALRFDPHVVLSASIDVPLIRRPTVVAIRDLAGTGWGEDAPPRDLWHRWRTRRFDRVVVPGRVTERAVRKLGVDPRKVRVVPDTIEGPGVARGTRREGPWRVVHPGRLLPAKGQHLSIDAVSRLPSAAKAKVELHVVGHVADRVYYDQLRVAARGQPVHFHVDADDLVPWYRDADLVLYPSQLREEWPDTALEAMAHGAAVAWTDHPSIREATGGLGLPLPAEDFAAIRSAVQRVIDAPEEVAKIGDAGRRFVDANYRWERVGPQWDGILRNTAWAGA